MAALDKSGKTRADLEAILLTGIPKGVVDGFTNFTGPVQADMLRLNTAIPPTTSKPSIFGLPGGDAAGFPNGRRVFDDVVSIELRAIAGVTYKLIDPGYTVDAAAGELTDGLTLADLAGRISGHFPYLGVPYDGYRSPILTARDARAHSRSRPAPAASLLDLGPGVGALVLHAAPEMDGREIEVSPLGAGAPAHRTHSRVRPRKTGDETQYAAVYPQLAAGDYVWKDDVTRPPP